MSNNTTLSQAIIESLARTVESLLIAIKPQQSVMVSFASLPTEKQ
jgi:hypothetical protein